jgi:hypothetical protein
VLAVLRFTYGIRLCCVVRRAVPCFVTRPSFAGHSLLQGPTTWRKCTLRQNEKSVLRHTEPTRRTLFHRRLSHVCSTMLMVVSVLNG